MPPVKSRKDDANVTVESQPKALLVLGMHRSGTSALAGVLGHMGCDLPEDLMAPADMNAKGFFESNRITRLNEEVLASAGMTWYSFPRFPREWFDSPKATEFAARAAGELRAEYNGSHLFVLKDPRICRLLPFWLKVFRSVGYQPLIAHIHRNPLDVAASLDRWANYEPDYSTLLWLRHILDAEAESRNERRVFVSYEALMSDWAATVAKIGDQLGLTWPTSLDMAMSKVNNFLSPELHHFRRPKGDRAPGLKQLGWVQQTYCIINEWSERCEVNSDHLVLDELREAFDAASSTFARMVARGQDLSHEARRLRPVQATLEAELKSLSQQLSQARREGDSLRAALEQDLSRSQATLNKSNDEAEQLRSAIEQRRKETDDLLAERNDSVARLEIALRDLATAKAERDDLQVKLERKSTRLYNMRRIAAEQMKEDLVALLDGVPVSQSRQQLFHTVCELKSRIQQLQQLHDAIEQQRRELAAQIAASQQRYDQMVNSRSWKWTAPLRNINRKLR